MIVSTDNDALPDLEQYRSYRKLLADLQLNLRLRVKEGSSDTWPKSIESTVRRRAICRILEAVPRLINRRSAQHLGRTEDAVAGLLRRGLKTP